MIDWNFKEVVACDQASGLCLNGTVNESVEQSAVREKKC